VKHTIAYGLCIGEILINCQYGQIHYLLLYVFAILKTLISKLNCYLKMTYINTFSQNVTIILLSLVNPECLDILIYK